MTFEDALKQAAKAVSDKNERDFLSVPETAIDVTGAVLTPGDPDNCLGNGFHKDAAGNEIECCCDECDHLITCAAAFRRKFDN